MVRHLFVVTLALSLVGCHHSTGPSTLTKIVVNGPTGPLAPGQTVSLTVTGFYSDGSFQDVSSQVTWTVQDPAVATISPAGLFTSIVVGATSVTATLQSLSASLAVQVRLPTSPRNTEFDLTLTATDDDGLPVTGARVSVEYEVFGAHGTTQVLGATDGVGVYHVGYSAAPFFIGEPFAEGIAAFAWVNQPGYEDDIQYIRATSQKLSVQFHLYRSRRITAGESTSVTVSPDAPICYNEGDDDHPWPLAYERVCRTVRVVAPANGVLTVEALSTQPGAPPPWFEIQDDLDWQASYSTARLSIPVTAGMEVMANVGIPWGSAGPQTFTLKTSLSAQGATHIASRPARN